MSLSLRREIFNKLFKSRNKMKKFFFACIYLMACFFCTLVILEIVFIFTIDMLPLKLHPHLRGKGVDILVQTSKHSVIPKDYIAVVGDSYAFGLGDWMREQADKSFFSSPPFQAIHLLHKKTGQDVVAFGQPGAGSISSIVKLITEFRYINSLLAFQIDKPKRILVYFYEGNDIYDNISDLVLRFDESGQDRQLFYNEAYFEKFINNVFLEKDPLFQKKGLIKNFLFSTFLFSGLTPIWNYLNEKFDFYKKFVSMPSKEPLSLKNGGEKKLILKDLMLLRSKTIDHNRISINGNEVQLPIYIEGPPFVGKSTADKAQNITKDYFEMAVYMFEQSVLFLKSHFKEVPIVIIYIPSPFSVYSIKSPFVIFQHFSLLGKYTMVKSDLIPLKSQEICVSIESVSKKHGFKFLDSRKYLRNAAAMGKPVHGPKDWGHFNKNGYEALSEGLWEVLFNKKNSEQQFGCKNN
jgi:hypothetical protein